MRSKIVYKIILVGLFFGLIWHSGKTQQAYPDLGLPYFETFMEKDHGGRQESYDITFDKRGIVYAGNSDGVLEYDGTRWNKISINNTRHITTLNYAEDQDRVYLGGYSEFGYIEANPEKQKKFQSLLPLVTPDERAFTMIQKSLTREGRTFFLARERLFVYDGSTIQTFAPGELTFQRQNESSEDPTFEHIFFIDKTPYILHSSEGLLQWSEAGLQPVGEEALFESLANIEFIIPFKKGEFLIGTRDGELNTFSKELDTIKPFRTKADDYLAEKKLTNAVVLNDGSIGLTTLTGGFVIVDEKGNWMQLLNKEADLPTNTIMSAAQAPKGAIWLAMNIGILRIEWPPVISLIDDRVTNFEEINSVVRFKDKLHVATPSGIYKEAHSAIDILKNEKLANNSSFENISDSPHAVYWLLPAREQLGVSSEEGVYFLDPDANTKNTIMSSRSLALLSSSQDSSRIHVLFPDSYTQLRYNGITKEFETIDSTYSFGELLHEVVVGEDEIWYISGRSIFRQDLDKAGLNSSFTRLKNTGLPDEGQYGGAIFDGTFTVGTSQGAYRFIENEQRFESDSVVNKLLERTDIFYGHRQIDENSFWLGYQNEKGNSIVRITKNNKGVFESQFAPFNRISQTIDSYVYSDPADSSVFWIAAVEGLLRYDERLHDRKNYEAGEVIIREVHTIQNDSLLLSNVSTRPEKVKFSAERQSLRFLFALPGNDARQLTTYRYYLEGFDQEWSIWTHAAQKDYTNIPPGEYTLHVEAKNGYGKNSKMATFPFVIATPWYQSTLAYLVYFLLGIGVFAYASIWYSNYRTEQQSIRMRAEQAEELAKLDRMKTNLLTNISHELRTPLTLVLGPIEQLRNKATELDDDWKRRLDIARRNGKRLHQLVEQVLDLTRLDAQQLKLDVRNMELTSFLGRLTESFESLAERNNVTIEPNLPAEKVTFQADPDKLEKAIVNLLSNAIKYTPGGGKVQMSLKVIEDKAIEISVSDTGRGIAAERLPHIFDRFHSTSEEISGGGKGLGVGLAITKEFIELHEGQISVESEEGAGTKFTILLPRKKQSSLADEEVIDEATIDEGDVAEELPEHRTSSIIDVAESFTVLVVEDNDDMRGYIADLLADEKLVVETAKNGLEARKRLSIINPDLIITDIMMPKMDGFTLAEQVRAEPEFRLTPIVMLSARAEVEDRIQGFEIGVSDYLSKPFNETELRARVQNLLHLKTERQKYADEGQERVVGEEKSSLLQRLQKFVEANLSESNITVEQLSEKVNLSRRQLYRNLKAETGCTPAEFIREIRLYKARDLLERNKKQTVSEVAYAVGFSTPSYFSKLFKNRFGRSPSEYG